MTDFTQDAGHRTIDTHSIHAGAPFTGIDGQDHHDTHVGRAVDADLLETIKDAWRDRVDLHRAEKSLTLQIKAKCRRMVQGDKGEAETLYKSMLNGQEHAHAMTMFIVTQPFVEARAVIEASRKAREKELTKLAKQLPVWGWVEQVKGFGALSLAGVIGESGDLSLYGNPAKLWKRMGLAVINGGRQRKVKGAEADEHGYSPHRRSLIWNIGESLIKQQGDYRALYLRRMAQEVEKCHAAGLEHATTTKATVESWLARGLPEPVKVNKIDAAKHRSCGHIHNRSKRYVEKRLLRNLWQEWRRA